MRRLLMMLAALAMLMTITAAPALADRPFTFTDSVTFIDVNPCTGHDDEITINVEVAIHEHRNNFVVHVDRSGHTLAGYDMIAGTESFVATHGIERGTFVDQWRHPDGSKFKVHGSFAYNLNQDELKFDNFRLECIGNG